MAGRGVDIKLGGGIVDLGGLYVLGTERHEARRIDNQLRGRSGRQGDPGESRFYLSAQDDLVRLFAGDRIYRIIDRFKIPEDQPMEAKLLSKQIETAQKKVEEQNFVSRKNVLKYDDVMNRQRVVIYKQRREVLEGADLSEEVKSWIDEVVERSVDAFLDPEAGDIDLAALAAHMQQLYGSEITADELREDKVTERAALIEEFIDDAKDEYAGKEEELGSDLMRELERFVILQVVDARWREHLENMDYLREGVHLRAMAQKDPLVEYTAEGHALFQELNGQIREEVLATLFHAQLAPEDAEQLRMAQEAASFENGGGLSYEHESTAGAEAIVAAGLGVESAVSTVTRLQQRTVGEHEKIGRNDPCWCGSGKKFKKCHGA
jgi:preprotein translocase subunit SecA